ncbi:2974_t:CDS:2 [Diversispora eburnea]|uniref:2974_t:CDS:1 n=1 Tax=Diversispora eburnea TaxID=1213867 RepID=A0A9N9BIF8_9GLOM|nr:2974_t:CDS:2 [Diversispora eburnea]
MSQVLRLPEELYKKYSITESFVSGILDLHFPLDDPVYAKQIVGTLISNEWERRSKLITQNIVWRSPSNTYQKINELQLLFQLELPNYLPSSVFEISYDLKAIIKRKSSILNFRGSTKSIIIRCPITRYSLLPTIPTLTQFSNYDDPSAVSRGIGFFVLIEHNEFSQLIPISIDFGLIFYKLDLEIKEVMLGVKQCIIIEGEETGIMKNAYIFKRFIKCDEIKNRLDHNNEYKSNVRFEIPPQNDTKLLDWRGARLSVNHSHLKISHKIKFKVKFGFFGGKDIKWKKDVKIENMMKWI